MDDDSCVLKYIEIVPLDNNAEQIEDLKPFEVKVCIATKFVTRVVPVEYIVQSMCQFSTIDVAIVNLVNIHRKA